MSFPLVPLGLVLSSPITDGPHSTPEFLSEGVPFLSVDGIQDGELDFTRSRYISEEDHIEFSKKAKPQKGDVLIGKAASTGKIALVRSDIEFNIWSPLAIIRPNNTVISSFLAYALKSIPSQIQIDNLCSYNTQKNIAMSDIPRIRIPFPPFETQQRIAEYLDRETAEIDAAVADLDEYVELLEQRRDALLIKETGIHGVVPMTKLGLHAQVSLGKTLQSEPKNETDRLVKYVRAGNIQDNGIFTGEQKQMWMSPFEIDALNIEPGDVLVVEGGAGFGRSITMEEGLPGWGFQNHVMRIRPYGGWVGKFLDYSIRAHKADGLIDLLTVGATIPGFSSERARHLPIAFLDTAAQKEVVRWLDEKLGELDGLMTESVRLRDLLIKRRSVLISDVVTGRKQV